MVSGRGRYRRSVVSGELPRKCDTPDQAREGSNPRGIKGWMPIRPARSGEEHAPSGKGEQRREGTLVTSPCAPWTWQLDFMACSNRRDCGESLIIEIGFALPKMCTSADLNGIILENDKVPVCSIVHTSRKFLSLFPLSTALENLRLGDVTRKGTTPASGFLK